MHAVAQSAIARPAARARASARAANATTSSHAFAAAAPARANAARARATASAARASLDARSTSSRASSFTSNASLANALASRAVKTSRGRVAVVANASAAAGCARHSSLQPALFTIDPTSAPRTRFLIPSDAASRARRRGSRRRRGPHRASSRREERDTNARAMRTAETARAAPPLRAREPPKRIIRSPLAHLSNSQRCLF